MHRAPRAHQQLIILHCLSHAEIVRNALLSALVFHLFLPANANAILFTTSTKCQVKYKEPVFVASQSVELCTCAVWELKSTFTTCTQKVNTFILYISHSQKAICTLRVGSFSSSVWGATKKAARLNTIKVFSSSLAIKHTF
jgi:hypothetical protein